MALNDDDLFEELDNTSNTLNTPKQSENLLENINMNDIMKNLNKYKPAELKKMLKSMSGNKEIQQLLTQMQIIDKDKDINKDIDKNELKEMYKNKLKEMKKSRNKK